MNKLIIKNCKRTCLACPSQWDIHTNDNKYIYVRYRWGHLSVTLDAFTGNDKVLFSWDSGDEWDGWMPTEDMTKLLFEILDFSNTKFTE